MRETRSALTAHLGGKPSVTQALLVERAAVLRVRLALMDRETLAGAEMSERNSRQYIAWQNAFCRTLAALGLDGAPERQRTPAEVMATLTRPGSRAA